MAYQEPQPPLEERGPDHSGKDRVSKARGGEEEGTLYLLGGRARRSPLISGLFLLPEKKGVRKGGRGKPSPASELPEPWKKQS